MEPILKQKWRWAGHIFRKPPEQWVCRLVRWRPSTSKRSAIRQQKRRSDDIREKVSRNGLQVAQDKKIWHNLKEAAVDKKRLKEEEKKSIQFVVL